MLPNFTFISRRKFYVTGVYKQEVNRRRQNSDQKFFRVQVCWELLTDIQYTPFAVKEFLAK